MSLLSLLPEKPETFPVLKCSNGDMEEIERFMLAFVKLNPGSEASCPVTHRFQDGVYLREVLMPASCVIGFEHKTEHFNLILSGHATVVMHDTIIEAEPLMTIRSGVGVRKLLCIYEPMRWLTIHKNPHNLCYGLEQNSPAFAEQLAQLEAEIFKPSETYLEFKASLSK